MAYKLKKLLANRKNYGGKRSLDKIKYIVVHYTANDGDTDEANAKYFKNNVVKASAHYFVDDDSVTQSVYDNYVAYHCGGGLQGKNGHAFYKKCTNTNSIGIEMCDTQRNGKSDLSAKTRANAVALIKQKMKQYNVPVSRVIRHYDVTGKLCPLYFAKDEKAWANFKALLTAGSKSSYNGKYPSLGLKGYLKKGDKGTQVKRLQMFLNWCINAGLTVDGSFGDNTEKAVKSFQKKYGLKVDGFFGRKSLDKAKTIKK
ncbi:MAG: N-acetylmuramoyl-L-alanine amidase [Acutalibacteraceae bacterium]|nr:N-acetylmuramoyl-L-alanine amidase [Acutalibacteraceae bacterium]